MKRESRKASLRCAIYTRVSTENGLEQEFNSLDNQREASEAYIRSQAHEGWKLIRDRYDGGGFSGGSMDRPALAKLLDDVRARRADVIVVYKVDRLTRSLADFAKLVDLFDDHDVSFISVTQAFNTTTSMARLTLNMLLSFAQFEREITGERIRDKVAVSKKRGIWMGGAIPLGYRVENRALQIVKEHAEFVRTLFKRYLETGSVVRLKAALDAENIRLPVRVVGAGRVMGGGLISRGHLHWILSNPIYVGRLRHRGQIHDGVHAAIVDQETWDRVQRRLEQQTQPRADPRHNVESFLAGKLYDDRSNRMGPSHAAKGGRRWRYYVSRAILTGRNSDAGSVTRVSAAQIEIQLSDAAAIGDEDRTLTLPRAPPSPYQRREIIQREGEPRSPIRPMRVQARAVLAESLRNAHRWLDELIVDPHQTIEAIAAREHKSDRSIRVTLSLAFVAPPIVAEAIKGRLPRGFGSKRLIGNGPTDRLVAPMDRAGA
jgi:site-specific DNA recombinase